MVTLERLWAVDAVVSFTVCCDTCIYALDAGDSTIIIGYHMQGRTSQNFRPKEKREKWINMDTSRWKRDNFKNAKFRCSIDRLCGIMQISNG